MRKIFSLFIIFLTGCAGMYIPHYRGPVLSQDNWLSACPKEEKCVVAEWHPPNQSNAAHPNYQESEWHCPNGYWYAPWIGASDRWQNPSPIPMLCIERKTFEERHIIKCPSGWFYGKDGAESELTPIGYGLWKVGVLRVFDPGCKVTVIPKSKNSVREGL